MKPEIHIKIRPTIFFIQLRQGKGTGSQSLNDAGVFHCRRSPFIQKETNRSVQRKKHIFKEMPHVVKPLGTKDKRRSCERLPTLFQHCQFWDA